MQTTDIALCIVAFIPVRQLFGKHVPCVSHAWHKACWSNLASSNYFFQPKHLKLKPVADLARHLQVTDCIDAQVPDDNQFIHVKYGTIGLRCTAVELDDGFKFPKFEHVQILELNLFAKIGAIQTPMVHVHTIFIQLRYCASMQNILAACPNVKNLHWQSHMYSKEVLKELPKTLTSINYNAMSIKPECMTLIGSLPLLEHLNISIDSAALQFFEWFAKINAKHKELEIRDKTAIEKNFQFSVELDSIIINCIPEDDSNAKFWIHRTTGLKRIDVRCYANDALLASMVDNVNCKDVTHMIIGMPNFLNSSGCPSVSPQACISLFKEFSAIQELHLHAKVSESVLHPICTSSMPFLKSVAFNLETVGENVDLGPAHIGVSKVTVALNPTAIKPFMTKFPNVRLFALESSINSDHWNTVCKFACIGQLNFSIARESILSSKLDIPKHIHTIENSMSYSWKDQLFHLLVWHASYFETEKQPSFSRLFDYKCSHLAENARVECVKYLNHCVMEHIWQKFVNASSHPLAYKATMQHLSQVKLQAATPEYEKVWETAQSYCFRELSNLFFNV